VNGHILSFSVANRPRWATFDTGTGELLGAPVYGDIGRYEGIVITAHNGDRTASLSPFSIEVALDGNGSGNEGDPTIPSEPEHQMPGESDNAEAAPEFDQGDGQQSGEGDSNSGSGSGGSSGGGGFFWGGWGSGGSSGTGDDSNSGGGSDDGGSGSSGGDNTSDPGNGAMTEAKNKRRRTVRRRYLARPSVQ
jgi:hypothetical protein